MNTTLAPRNDAVCRRCGATGPPAARFCMACGVAITATQPAQARIRLVTVVFCDVERSTELAVRLGGELWNDVLEAYFTDVSQALHAQGGRLEKFIGDAVVGVFGADGEHEDDAVRAVQAAGEALRRLAARAKALRRRGIELSVRFGIASGRVLTTTRSASFAVGPVTNRAARLQQFAPSGGVVLDLKTWLLARQAVRCRPLDPVEAKGFAQPLRCWLVEQGGDVQHGGPPVDQPVDQLVNQRRLMADLTTRLERAMREPGLSTLALEGDIGVGKTRILHQLGRALESRGQVLFVTCKHDGDRRGLWPLQQLDHELARLSGGQVGPARDERAGRSAHRSAEELRWTLRRRLARLSRRRPVVVIVDDCHKALDQLAQLCGGPDEPGGGSVVLLLSGRALPALPIPEADRLAVPLLAPAESRTLLESLSARLSLSGALPHADEIVLRSGGNPLFLEQLAALTASETAPETGAATGAGADRRGLIAPSAEAALGSRIDRLGPQAVRILGCAGAWGGQVALTDLLATCGMAEAEVDAALAQLAEGGLELTSAFVGEVAYTRLRLADRARVHADIAEHLRRRALRHPGDIDSAALHAEHAHRAWHDLAPGAAEDRSAAARAAGCLCAAARLAISRADVSLGLELAGRARRLRIAGPALEAEIGAIETYALAACGRPAEALARIRRTRARVPARANLPAAANLRANELAILFTRGTWDAELLRQAHRLAELSGDAGTRARLLLLEALRAAQSGDYRAAEASLRVAESQARRAAYCFGESEIFGNLALCLAYGGTPVTQALAECADLRRRLAETPVRDAAVACPMAFLLAMRGHGRRAESLLAEAESVFAGTGHLIGKAGAYEFRGMVRELQEDLPGAAGWLDRAAALYREMGLAAAAERCRMKSALATGVAPKAPLRPGPRAPWDMRALAHQVAALRQQRLGHVEAARGHLAAALHEIEGVRGEGAVIIALRSCLRLSASFGPEADTARIRAALTEAEKRKT
ncbi:AAA family ATPase [Nonomuraea sp. NPDC003707]